VTVPVSRSVITVFSAREGDMRRFMMTTAFMLVAMAGLWEFARAGDGGLVPEAWPEHIVRAARWCAGVF